MKNYSIVRIGNEYVVRAGDTSVLKVASRRRAAQLVTDAAELLNSLPPSYFRAFEALANDPHIQLVVAEDGEGAVVGCLQLCILPGLSSQGASRGLIEDVRVATHCRSRGMGERMVRGTIAEARPRGCRLVALFTHNTRVDAQRFYARLGFQPSHVGMTLRF